MKHIVSGLAAGVGLILLYATTMTLLSGTKAAVEQFKNLWYLMVPLAVGFGIQVGLYTKLIQTRKHNVGTIATGGTSAGVGMLACCAHHVTDVLPIIGLSAAATVVAQYQVPILLLSLLINVIGIGIMWHHLKNII